MIHNRGGGFPQRAAAQGRGSGNARWIMTKGGAAQRGGVNSYTNAAASRNTDTDHLPTTLNLHWKEIVEREERSHARMSA